MENPQPERKPILLLGIGNSLQSDDGIGAQIIKRMPSMQLPENVEICIGGTAGINLLNVIEKRRRLVVIDAVDGGQEPGTLFRFTPENIPVGGTILNSLHQIGLMETLQMAKLMECAPDETIILGIQPRQIDWGTELSEEIEKRIPRLISMALEEISKPL